jgi:hypothetical protein
MTDPERPVDPRLGLRIIDHDPQNLEHLARPLTAAMPQWDRDRYWPMPDGNFPLNQGDKPECTGYGTAHELALGPVQILGMTPSYAHARYLRNVQEDRKMGRRFTGGATVAATMRAAKKDGLITGYVWNLGLSDTVDALTNVGPVCLGTTWRSDMFRPDGDGRLRCTGSDAGGHFWVLAARVRNHPKFGAGCWMVQTWGRRWGVGVKELNLTAGCAFVVDDDLHELLAAHGESVIMRDFYEPPQRAPFHAIRGARTFHRAAHATVRRDQEFGSFAEAIGSGLRPCAIFQPTET